MHSETTTLNVRNLPVQAARRFDAAAAIHGMTLAEYLTALADLHDAIRARVAVGIDESGITHDAIAWDLDSPGLGPVDRGRTLTERCGRGER